MVPKSEHIALIQDKGCQKQFFKDNQIPTSDFTVIEAGGDISSLDLPIVQKLRTGGYDGRGVQILNTSEDILERGFNEACVLEKVVNIDKELGVIDKIVPKVIPDNSLVVGSPGKVVREVTEDEKNAILGNTKRYQDNWKKYSKSIF